MTLNTEDVVFRPSLWAREGKAGKVGSCAGFRAGGHSDRSFAGFPASVLTSGQSRRTQFGGRNASSTLDAGLTLLHDVQAAHQTGLRAGVLLFDIQGFFDNINHDRLTKIFTNLGFATELVSWCKSFLKDRTVRLKFNVQRPNL